MSCVFCAWFRIPRGPAIWVDDVLLHLIQRRTLRPREAHGHPEDLDRTCPCDGVGVGLRWGVLSPPLPSLTQSCIPRRSSSFSDFSVSFCTPASCHSPCYLQPSSLSLRNPDDSQGADYYSNLSILETVPSRPELCPSPLVHILTALLKISWNFNHTPIPKGIHVFLLRSVFPCHLHFCNGTTRLPLTWA